MKNGKVVYYFRTYDADGNRTSGTLLLVNILKIGGSGINASTLKADLHVAKI